MRIRGAVAKRMPSRRAHRLKRACGRGSPQSPKTTTSWSRDWRWCCPGMETEDTNKPEPKLISALFLRAVRGRVHRISRQRGFRLRSCSRERNGAGQWCPASGASSRGSDPGFNLECSAPGQCGRDRLRDEDPVGPRAARLSAFPDQQRRSIARRLLPGSARAGRF